MKNAKMKEWIVEYTTKDGGVHLERAIGRNIMEAANDVYEWYNNKSIKVINIYEKVGNHND